MPSLLQKIPGLLDGLLLLYHNKQYIIITFCTLNHQLFGQQMTKYYEVQQYFGTTNYIYKVHQIIRTSNFLEPVKFKLKCAQQSMCRRTVAYCCSPTLGIMLDFVFSEKLKTRHKNHATREPYHGGSSTSSKTFLLL